MSTADRRPPAGLAAAALLLAAGSAAAQSPEAPAPPEPVDPVVELRHRQQRLTDLEYAIREAELVQRLCQLAPGDSECGDGGAAPGAAPGEVTAAPLPPPLPDYRLLEVFGSRGALQAVLAGGGRQRILPAGGELAPGVTVHRVRPDSVELLTPAGITTLRIGEH